MLHAFLRVAEEDGLNPKSLPLKVGIFGAEPWSKRMREEIESRLGLVAMNVYGLSEIIGPGVSIECTEKGTRPQEYGNGRFRSIGTWVVARKKLEQKR